MNQHPIYMTASSSEQRDHRPSSPRHLETLVSDSGGGIGGGGGGGGSIAGAGALTLTAGTPAGAFQPIASFHPQTTSYYSPAPTTFHVSSSFGHDRKDYLTTIHGLTPVRLPALSSALTGGTSISNEMTSLPPLKEHPAAQQADQMNAYMEFFVDPEQGSSNQSQHRNEMVVVDDDMIEEQQLDKDIVLMGGLSDDSSNFLDDDDDERKRQRVSEVARMRYHRLSDDQKRQVNHRRAELMKKKRQMERERRELDDILRETHDLDDSEDVDRSSRSEMTKARRAEAARSRYQRMSEQERKAYNQRRRLKALGIDPDSSKVVDDVSAVKDTIRQANAKKAEAARLRYHRMSPEERREYNQRRTESFRKRRQEEEALLSTPAGRISADALARAQQIMIRNARKAEAARARYQKMTPEQRKEYNIRRAQSKKARSGGMGGATTPSMMSTDCSLDGTLGDEHDHHHHHLSHGHDDRDAGSSPMGLDSSFPSEPPANILESSRTDLTLLHKDTEHLGHLLDGVQSSDSSLMHMDGESGADVAHHHMGAVTGAARVGHAGGASLHHHSSSNNSQSSNNSSAVVGGGGGASADDIFQQMERDVVKRTKQAQLTLARQRQDTGHMNCTRYINSQMGHHEQHMMQAEPPQVLIDEKALHDMLMTGRDANGVPVELRTLDGQRINEEHELRAMAAQQPIVIQPIEPPSLHDGGGGGKDQIPIYIGSHHGAQQQDQQLQSHMVPSTSSQEVLYSNGHDVHDLRNYRNHSHSVVVSEGNSLSSSMMDGVTGGGGGADANCGGGNQNVQNMQNMSPGERHALSKARRAERARIRYHSMRPEIRQQQNARRADLLRKARQRDEHLVQLADQVNSPDVPEETRQAIADAQLRRARRAEQARAKYHRMNSEERRQYNAMRDAQRRQRKRQQESRGGRDGSGGMGHHDVVRGLSENGSTNSGSLSPPPETRRGGVADAGEQLEEQVIYGAYDMYDQPMPGWEP